MGSGTLGEITLHRHRLVLFRTNEQSYSARLPDHGAGSPTHGAVNARQDLKSQLIQGRTRERLSAEIGKIVCRGNMLNAVEPINKPCSHEVK